MNDFLLTDAERTRFASYLERMAASDEALILQMQKISVPDAIIKKSRMEALAATVVAARLRANELA